MDPYWYKDAIIYETHVRAFFDYSNNGNGDFRGLTYKLDYLQDLGINCLWLLPFYPSPLRDDGYDIADYKAINPLYGTFQDFRAFIREAHRRGIRVITELVINHTSDQHPWFQAARKAKPGSSRRNYYVWSHTDQAYKQVRIIFSDSEKSNWTWDPEAGAYYWHRFFHHQPDLNFQNPVVLRDMIRVLHFWLDQGVDGMRLDAVPYLTEAENTNCENLPETHRILKEIRKQVDSNYGGRMLLAEANQWPEDVLPYFGDGDECHMAFHFPLMPRIFMALRQEDRHPITDIMRLTPGIPEACQWALFLRNHDELTLEMVTDEERDYMYSAYAADPRMRINSGIRRRLAPLMGNSRRRMELLNSLLFSFKGTPIIYYGDEIGMGDNFYLGDRNGVRTPMQWSGDRNAGFSKADFAKLYSPPILDPVYGYQSINVEAQQRDPSSLLLWMKRLIALRKRFPVFGRGTIEFLLPRNRKILAYIRNYQDVTILCVANLSRFVQPFDLDLSRYDGLTPVEMFGQTEFPPITNKPYFLTIAPHSFYWFQLQKVAETISIRVVSTTDETQELPVVEVAGTWEMVRTKPIFRDQQSDVLRSFMVRQDWIGEAGDKIQDISIVDRIFIDSSRPLSYILIVEAHAKGANQLYSVPLSVRSRVSAGDKTVARVKTSTDEGFLVDGLSDPAFCEELLMAIRDQMRYQSPSGVLVAEATSDFIDRLAKLKKPIKIATVTEEQRNTSIVYGNRFIFKFFRRLAPGPNPDVELLRFLNENTAFTRVPTYLGSLEYRAADSQQYTIAALETWIPNQGSAWSHTLEEIARYFERAASRKEITAGIDAPGRSVAEWMEADIAPEVGHLVGSYFNEAAAIGRRTAELHLALASSQSIPAFAPEMEDISAVKRELLDNSEHVFNSLRTMFSALPSAAQSSAKDLLGRVLEVSSLYEGLKEDQSYGMRIRIHGDYHLGQLLWVENDFVIIDFEGDPSRSVAERRNKRSALKDVAAMIRSFSYAVHAKLAMFSLKEGRDADSLHDWAQLWFQTTSSMFLTSYLKTASGAPFLPMDRDLFANLLHCYLVDKALQELHYELAKRPDWAWIPLAGILELIKPR